MSNVSVTVNGAGASGNTNGVGAFSFVVASGSYTLTLSRAGYTTTTTASYPVNGGQTTDTGVITLPFATGTVIGTVVAAAGGAAIPGATVKATGTSTATAATDAAGAFNMTLPAGGYTLTVGASGYADKVTTSFSVQANQQTNQGAISLSAGGTLTGTVLNSITGTPLAGATVQFAGRQSTTNASGAFSYGVAAGSSTLGVFATGFNNYFSTTTFVVTAGQTTATGNSSITPTSGFLTGHVIHSEDGSPAFGATALITGTGTSVTTDSSGNFTLAATPGSASVTVSSSGYVAVVSSTVTATLGQTTNLGTFSLVQSGIVTGTVVDSVTTSPIASATVTITGSSLTAFTNASGLYTILAPPGSQTLTITKTGYSPGTGSVSVVSGQTTSAGTISLVQGGTLTGTVVSAVGGAAVSGVTVTVTGTSNFATTNASGAFTLTQAPGNWTVTLTASAWVTATSGLVTLITGQSTSAGTISIVPKGTITGTVVNSAGGGPANGATVTVTGTSTTFATGATGFFTLQQPPGIYTLSVGDSNWGLVTTSPLTVAAGQTANAGTITVTGAAQVTSYVVTAVSGTPLGGVSVAVTGTTAYTTSLGTFPIYAAGTLSVTLSKPGFKSATFGPVTTIPGHDIDLGSIFGVYPHYFTLTLAQAGQIVGTVVDGSGAPVAGATVTVTGTSVSAATDAFGNFVVSPDSGTYTLTVTKTGWQTVTTGSFAAAISQETNAGTITLTPGTGTLTGTVVNSSGGAAIAGATVTVAGTSNTATTDGSGAFTLTQTVGSAILVVSAPGFATAATSPFTVTSGQNTPAGAIQLSSSAGTLAGSVVNGAPGAALPGVTVNVTNSAISAVTDGSGSFSLALAPGTYTVTLSKSEWGTLATGAYTVTAGQTKNTGVLSFVPQTGVVTGSLVSSYGGTPVAGAAILDNTVFTTTNTSATGGFRLSTTPGSRTLVLSKSDWPDASYAVAVTAGQTTNAGNVPMTGTGSIVGLVYLQGATNPGPVPGATITATGTSTSVTSENSINFTGTFRLTIAPGTYTLTVSAPASGAITTITAPFTVRSGQITEAGYVNLYAPGQILGTVESAVGGALIPGATVTLVETGNTTTTDASGGFSLTDNPGTYSLLIFKNGFVTRTFPGVVVPSGGISFPDAFLLTPISVAALSLSPTTVVGPAPSTATVTISPAAPAGGSVVSLASTNTAAATVPATVTVAAGATTATFTVTSLAVTSAATSTISASLGGVTKNATLTVNPPPPAALSGVAPGWVLPGDTTPLIYGSNIQSGSNVILSGPVYALTDIQHPLCVLSPNSCAQVTLAGAVNTTNNAIGFAIPPETQPGIYSLQTTAPSGQLSSNNEFIAVDSAQQTRATVPPEQKQIATRIYPGQTVTGTFTGTNPLNSISDYDYYYFIATAGSSINLSMQRVDTSVPWENPASLDPQIEVIAPDGFIYQNLQAFDNTPGIDYNASLTNAVLPLTGVYIITAETTRGSGQYALSFSVASMAPVAAADRAVPLAGNFNTVPLNRTVHTTASMLDLRGWPVAGAAVTYGVPTSPDDKGTVAFAGGNSAQTTLDGGAVKDVTMTAAGKVRFSPSFQDPVLAQWTAGGDEAFRAGAAGEETIPRYRAAARRAFSISEVSQGEIRITDQPLERLPDEVWKERFQARKGGAKGNEATASAVKASVKPLPLSIPKPLAGRASLVITTCSPATFNLAGVSAASVNPPFTVTLTDITPSTGTGVIGADGIKSHRIEGQNGQTVLRFRLDIKDGSGNAPPHPVLVDLAVGGPHHGTLILDPDGNRIECATATFVWHETDAQGNPTTSNEEFEYRLGTLATIAGFIPDPNHSGQVLPVWSETEALDLSISTVDVNGTTLQTSQEYAVRPEAGRPAALTSSGQLRGVPYDDLFEFWPDFQGDQGLSTFTANTYYVTDQYLNIAFGYPINFNVDPASNVFVFFVDQLGRGWDSTWNPAGYELDVNWSGTVEAGTYPINVSLSYSDPDWPGTLTKQLTVSMIKGTFGTLFRGLAGYSFVDSGFPLSVSPAAQVGAIPGAGDGTGKRLVLLALRGTQVPFALGNPSEIQTVDPHVEISDQEAFRLSIVDASGASVMTDAAFTVHSCPRWATTCVENPILSASGIASVTMNNSSSASENHGYLGAELTQAPANPGAYFLLVESMNQKYRVRQLADLKPADTPAGEFKGAFAICTVIGGQFLDEDFVPIDPYVVQQDTTAYFRYLSNGSAGALSTATITSVADSDPLQTASITIPIARLGQSRTYMAGPFTLQPPVPAPPSLRASRTALFSGESVQVFSPSSKLTAEANSKDLGYGNAVVNDVGIKVEWLPRGESTYLPQGITSDVYNELEPNRPVYLADGLKLTAVIPVIPPGWPQPSAYEWSFKIDGKTYTPLDQAGTAIDLTGGVVTIDPILKASLYHIYLRTTFSSGAVRQSERDLDVLFETEPTAAIGWIYDYKPSESPVNIDTTQFVPGTTGSRDGDCQKVFPLLRGLLAALLPVPDPPPVSERPFWNAAMLACAGGSPRDTLDPAIFQTPQDLTDYLLAENRTRFKIAQISYIRTPVRNGRQETVFFDRVINPNSYGGQTKRVIGSAVSPAFPFSNTLGSFDSDKGPKDGLMLESVVGGTTRTFFMLNKGRIGLDGQIVACFINTGQKRCDDLTNIVPWVWSKLIFTLESPLLRRDLQRTNSSFPTFRFYGPQKRSEGKRQFPLIRDGNLMPQTPNINLFLQNPENSDLN